MNKVAAGGGIDAKLGKQAVAECVSSVLHSPDAMWWLSQLKAKDEYTTQYSMNVCMLSIVLGRQVDLNTQELNDLGLCGMMHDMGKMLVPLHILNKPGKLEAEELKIMQSHTSLAHIRHFNSLNSLILRNEVFFHKIIPFKSKVFF